MPSSFRDAFSAVKVAAKEAAEAIQKETSGYAQSDEIANVNRLYYIPYLATCPFHTTERLSFLCRAGYIAKQNSWRHLPSRET